jgi:hypothetical protein
LVNWKGNPGRQPRHVVSDGVAFTNNGVALVNPGRPKKDMATVDCHNCGEYGHYATDCPKPKKQTGEQLLMAGVESGEFDNDVAFDNKWNSFAFVNDGAEGPRSVKTTPDAPPPNNLDNTLEDNKWTICDDDWTSFVFANNRITQPRSVGTTLNINKESRILKSWMLLGNQSIMDVFHNKALLKRIRVSKSKHIDIHCNAGVTSTNLVGDLPGYGTVWYHPKGIANILLLHKVKEKYLVTNNSRDGNAIVVHKDSRSA